MAVAGIINVGNITYNTTKTGGTLPPGAPVTRDYPGTNTSSTRKTPGKPPGT
ncbi:MAG TPA: hypothetical protein VF126_04560 [Acidobacteriaceae bacterium]